MANDSGNGVSPEVAALGAASINALGGLAVNAAKNKKQWKYQQKAMELQRQYNLEGWNMQNAYNTPQAQMERLLQAGLNPRLIYGGGSSAPNMAAPPEIAEVPVRQAAGAEMPNLLQYYQVRQMDAQYRNTTMATDVMEKTMAVKELEAGLKNLQLMKGNIESNDYQHMQNLAVANNEALLRKNQAAISAIHQGMDLKTEQIENEKRKGMGMDQLRSMREKQITGVDLDNAFKANRNELAKHGIYSSDHAALRLLLKGAQRMDMSLTDLLGQGYESVKKFLENAFTPNKWLGKDFLKKE